MFTITFLHSKNYCTRFYPVKLCTHTPNIVKGLLSVHATSKCYNIGLGPEAYVLRLIIITQQVALLSAMSSEGKERRLMYVKLSARIECLSVGNGLFKDARAD